jgi:hypothetical protein
MGTMRRPRQRATCLRPKYRRDRLGGHAWLTVACLAPSAALPLVVGVALATQGWSGLLFDYRGYARKPGSPSEGLVADARAARAYTAASEPTHFVLIAGADHNNFELMAGISHRHGWLARTGQSTITGGQA